MHEKTDLGGDAVNELSVFLSTRPVPEECQGDDDPIADNDDNDNDDYDDMLWSHIKYDDFECMAMS